jgi:hypothetical protein
MTPASGSFAEYVSSVVNLNAKYFTRLRLAQGRKALASRRIGRDEGAEQRWYGEGGNSQTADSRQARPA